MRSGALNKVGVVGCFRRDAHCIASGKQIIQLRPTSCSMFARGGFAAFRILIPDANQLRRRVVVYRLAPKVGMVVGETEDPEANWR